MTTTSRTCALLLVFAALAAACEGPAFIARTVQGEPKIEAVYTLADRPTLVMVDDPENRLGSSTLAGVVAANAAQHLREQGVIKAPIVPERELAARRVELGSDYYTTPIDRIGREVGAEQVIYARVEQAVLQVAPGYYRPMAVLEVKVVDATTGKRLYPPSPPIDEPSAPSRGRTLQVQLPSSQITTSTPGTDAAYARKLAEQAGLQVAQLFYAHKPPPRFQD